MIELLVGPVCSGKSSYARKRAQQGAIIINDDAVVEAVHGGKYSLYSKGLKPLYKMVENTIFQIAITLGRDVIIDRPNMSLDQRRRWIGLAKAYDEQVVAVVFPNRGPEYHARARLKKDSRGLNYEHWIGAAIHHQQNFKAPSLEEGLIDIVPVQAVS